MSTGSGPSLRDSKGRHAMRTSRKEDRRGTRLRRFKEGSRNRKRRKKRELRTRGGRSRKL